MGYCSFVKGSHGERVKIPGCTSYLYDDGCPCMTFDKRNRGEAIERLLAAKDGIDAKLEALGYSPTRGDE